MVGAGGVPIPRCRLKDPGTLRSQGLLRSKLATTQPPSPPDGKPLYVGNLNDATVTPIRVPTNTAGPAIPVGNRPVAIVVTPNGKMAYVSNKATTP